MPADMPHISENDLIRNHIFLAPNGEYRRHLVKLCELCVEHEKKVLLMTQNQMSLPGTLKKPRSLVHMERWMSIALKDIESAPRRIIELYDCQPRPDLIIFDMHSIVAELIGRPVLQQCSRKTLVRHVAKCAAAFCNYLEMVHVSKQKHNRNAVDAIVIMPTETYPLTPAQFKLLIGLYFSGNELYTNFSALSERIRLSQGLH
ncbi:uncharacterized protein [Drosophila virilis]|uniref:Uncharacterized protein n=1 Tax=Drosophila virilis TaxID=7244 RepID=B4M2C1_DROVI|nr:uncharacterized protein LOC6632069 [Drosophila virilis]EDW65825.2 uncharacterized protein Dvir_GJ19461 [Drosophila virilis]